MTIGSILLATALFVLVGLYVFRPLLLPVYQQAGSPTERERLFNEKEALLEEIRALDFDFETGKLPSAEYKAERAFKVQQAANLLRQLEEMPEQDDSVEAQIEAAIAALRGNQHSAIWTCNSCQSENPAENSFCGQCGGERA